MSVGVARGGGPREVAVRQESIGHWQWAGGL